MSFVVKHSVYLLWPCVKWTPFSYYSVFWKHFQN